MENRHHRSHMKRHKDTRASHNYQHPQVKSQFVSGGTCYIECIAEHSVEQVTSVLVLSAAVLPTVPQQARCIQEALDGDAFENVPCKLCVQMAQVFAWNNVVLSEDPSGRDINVISFPFFS